MDNIYEYLDYRKLLKDRIGEEKEKKPVFSYRYIAAKVGFSSPGFLTNIIAGKRNISPEMIFKFASLFKFSKKERDYFEALVQYNQAGDHERARYYFERVLSLRKSKVHQLTSDQYEYFKKWYYVAVREVLNFYRFTGDYRELGRMLRPPISEREAKAAIECLERLKLVCRDDDGVYCQSENTAAVTSVPNVPPVAVHNFQIATMELAREAIDRVPRERRSISTLTLNLSEQAYKSIEEKLAEFRREALQIVQNSEGEVDRVYQFNFQIYPLTRDAKDKRQ